MNAYEQMREATSELRDEFCLLCKDYTECIVEGGSPCEIIDRANMALAKKPRQCDTGTAEEQAERFHKFCTKHRCAIAGMCDPNCPCAGSQDECLCLFKWGQMPYEEGGAE